MIVLHSKKRRVGQIAGLPKKKSTDKFNRFDERFKKKSGSKDGQLYLLLEWNGIVPSNSILYLKCAKHLISNIISNY